MNIGYRSCRHKGFLGDVKVQDKELSNKSVYASNVERKCEKIEGTLACFE